MKKVFSKIGTFFGAFFGIILALLVGICFVLLLPLDYIKYKRSLFYKNEHKKYKFFAGSGFYFEFYNEIAKNDLPIKYMFNPKNDALECGWFVFDKTLLIPDAMVEYHSDVEKWFCSEYDGGHDVASVPLDEYLQQEIATINELLEYNVCNKAVVLVDVNKIENIDIAKQENRFLIYDDNREEVVKTFCSNNLK